VQLGMIGLGRMGGNMAQRLLQAGHGVVAYDPVNEALGSIVSMGATGATSVGDLVGKLPRPRVVWLMVPSGQPAEDAILSVSSKLTSGDIVVDGGNSYYGDTRRRAAALSEKGIRFVDVGTSGGIWGLAEGYCLMVGGDTDAYHHIEPVLRSLAPSPDAGYGHVGPVGAGHFVKMVHNGIEYGLMQSYAEGFELLQAKSEFNLDLYRVAEIWRYGSVIRSWLLDLAAAALREDPGLEAVGAYVEDTGEGRWTVQESVRLAVPLPVITQALQARFRSRQQKPFGARLLAALRQQFGGHPVKSPGD